MLAASKPEIELPLANEIISAMFSITSCTSNILSYTSRHIILSLRTINMLLSRFLLCVHAKQSCRVRVDGTPGTFSATSKALPQYLHHLYYATPSLQTYNIRHSDAL